MAKLRPLKTDEEIRAIPADQPVLIELPANMDSTEPDAPVVADTGTTVQKSEPEDAAAKVQKQLEDMQRAGQVERERLTRERDEARESARLAQQEHASTEQQLVTTGLARAQADLSGAKAAYKAAMEAGDYDKAADAQALMSRASAMILAAESAGAEAGQRAEELKRQPQQDRQQAPDPMQAMEASPQLFPAEKAWFRLHPEAFTDNRMNTRLNDAYFRAEEKGIVRGTPDYFKFIDQHMGYAKPETTTTQDEDTTVMGAAPVTRQNNSVGGTPQNNSQITLTPEQRQLCSTMGISEVDYAMQLRNMNMDKKANPDRYYINGR